MSEANYILLTNLAKLRIVERIVSELFPEKDLDAWKMIALRELGGFIATREAEVDRGRAIYDEKGEPCVEVEVDRKTGNG